MSSKPRVASYQEQTHNFLKENGYVETLQGHRRNLQDVWGGGSEESAALRQSVNTIIQGTGAYLTNFAVTLIDDYIQKYNKKAALVATVHDSILLDVPEDEIIEMASVVKALMENLPIPFLQTEINGKQTRYPIEADVEVGLNYNDKVGFDADLYKTFEKGEYYANFQWDKHQVVAHKDSKKITQEEADTLQGAIDQLLPKYQTGEITTMFEPLYTALENMKENSK